MKVLVLGGAGMLGHKLVQTLRDSGHEAIPTIRGSVGDSPAHSIPLFRQGTVVERLDVADEATLQSVLDRTGPDAIVNCVGVIKQRGAAKEAVPSIRVNSLLPHLLAESAERRGTRLVHLSTDCVFDGARGGYNEADAPNATDLYGRSKALGEVTESPCAITLRTSIIGRELSHFASLVEWFLAQEGALVRGFRRALYSGLTTNALSALIVRLLQERPDLHGLWQVGGPPIDKDALLRLVAAAFGSRSVITPDDSFVLDRTLDSSRFWRETGWMQPHWPGMIAQMAADPTPYSDWQLKG